MEILAICFGFVGLYATFLVLKLLRYACAALKIWINLQKYGNADVYAGYYERKRDERK